MQKQNKRTGRVENKSHSITISQPFGISGLTEEEIKILESNKELISILDKKIKAKIASVWGE